MYVVTFLLGVWITFTAFLNATIEVPVDVVYKGSVSACENNGGVRNLEIDINSNLMIECSNGMTKEIKSDK